MERLLFLWDELDDWLGAGRHLLLALAATSGVWQSGPSR